MKRGTCEVPALQYVQYVAFKLILQRFHSKALKQSGRPRDTPGTSWHFGLNYIK